MGDEQEVRCPTSCHMGAYRGERKLASTVPPDDPANQPLSIVCSIWGSRRFWR